MDQKLDVRQQVRELGRAARAAARALARADAEAKNRALAAMAKDIRFSAKKILAANSADVAQADGADAAFIDRLTLTPKLIEQMAEGVEQVARLADPVGQISERVKRPTARGGRAARRYRRPRRGRRADHADRICRPHRAARRQGIDRAALARIAHPDDQAPRRRVPRLPRRQRRSGDGDQDRRQREDAALRHLQHDGDAAGCRINRAQGASQNWRHLQGEERRDARRFADPKIDSGGQSRDREGLLHRVAGADRLDPRREGPRRGDRAHRQVRLAAYRRHRRRGPRARRALPARSRLELGDVERLDALRRRLRVRPGRRGRHLDRQAARPRPGGPGRPHDPEVRRAGPRRGPHLKVGILGGTFDPVHNAHLAMARAAMWELDLDKLLWMPTGAPRYRNAPVAPAEDRVAMLRLATEGEPLYEIDTRELAPNATGYTVDTLESLRADLDSQLYLLLGGDQYAKFDTWHKPQEVARLARIAVFSRPGFKIEDQAARVIPFPAMPVSASDIRARAARGEDLSGLVPPAVAGYIARRRLYR